MAGKATVKKKEHENLSDANIEKVIGLLERKPSITKKEACEILNITYNTTRLARIIEEFRDNRAEEAKRRSANRGKPAALFEIQTIIEGQLASEPVADIAKQLYRSPAFVKRVIEETVGLPEKGSGYFGPEIIPEQLVADKFKLGQIVWSARYNTLAIVTGHALANSERNKQEYDCYEIWVIEHMEEIDASCRYFPSINDYGGFFANQAYYDLGSMEHLKQFGIDIYKPYRTTFAKWLAGDFSLKYGEKRWKQMLASGVEVYASC